MEYGTFLMGKEEITGPEYREKIYDYFRVRNSILKIKSEIKMGILILLLN